MPERKRLKRRAGFSIIEVLVAFTIIIIALAIVFIAPSGFFRLAQRIQIETDIYDVAFSFAEEMLLEASNTAAPKTITVNQVSYFCNVATGTWNFVGQSVDMATVTVQPSPTISGLDIKVIMPIILRKP